MLVYLLLNSVNIFDMIIWMFTLFAVNRHGYQVVTVLLPFSSVITLLEDQAGPDTETGVALIQIETADNSRMIAPSKTGASDEVRVEGNLE